MSKIPKDPPVILNISKKQIYSSIIKYDITGVINAVSLDIVIACDIGDK